MSSTLETKWDYIFDTVDRYKKKYDLPEYDWQLRTDLIVKTYEDFGLRCNQFVEGAIDEERFKFYLKAVGRVIYKETLRLWNLKSEIYRQKRQMITEPLPIDTVKIGKAEMDFINNRMKEWHYRDGGFEKVVDDVIDNSFPEQDLSHIPIPDRKGIDDKKMKLNFGRKHPDQTIEDIMRIDCGYLYWLIKNVDRIKFAPTLEKEIIDKYERERLWD